MGYNLTLEELERRWAEVDARPAEEPTAEDLAAFAEADAEDPADAVTLEECFMDEIVLKTPFSMEEIEENFKDFDLTASFEQVLKDALA